LRDLPPQTHARCDTFVLAAFAAAWDIHKRAVEALQGQPLVITGVNGGRVKNPLVDIVNSQARIMASLDARLFLDPVSRLILRAPAETAPSKFGELLSGRQERERRYDA
jgi:P27 family predicted phage terminase small subunit